MPHKQKAGYDQHANHLCVRSFDAGNESIWGHEAVGTPARIRRACAEDVTQIADFIRAGADEGVFHSRSGTPDEQVEELREFTFVSRPEEYQMIVAEGENRPVSYADFRQKRGVGEILGIYVDPRHRRRGIGTMLMRRALADLSDNGCHKARLDVFADNQGAVRFYESLGFTSEGLLRKDEEKKDVIVMSKFLGGAVL